MEESDKIALDIIEALKKGQYKYESETTCDCAYDDAKCGMYAYTDHEVKVGDYTFTIQEENTGGDESDYQGWEFPEELQDTEYDEEISELLYEIWEPTDWISYWETYEDDYYDDEEDEEWEGEEWEGEEVD